MRGGPVRRPQRARSPVQGRSPARAPSPARTRLWEPAPRPSRAGPWSLSRERGPVVPEASTTGSWASRDVERLTHRERLCVQGLADDRALPPVRDQLAQRAQVLEGGDPAGGDDLRLRARAHLPQQVQVRAAQGAVLGDVRDDVALAAGLVEPLEGLPEVASLAGPAPGG